MQCIYNIQCVYEGYIYNINYMSMNIIKYAYINIYTQNT